MKISQAGSIARRLLDGPARLAWGWLALVLALAAFLVMALPRAAITSDVMALLPQKPGTALEREMTSAFASRMSRQLVLAVSGPEAAAETFCQKLLQTPGLDSVSCRLDPEAAARSSRFLFEHRAAFLSEAARSRLQDGGRGQAAWVASQLFSAMAGISANEVRRDPLLLMRSSTLAEGAAQGLAARDGWVSGVDKEGRLWRLVSAEASEKGEPGLAGRIRRAESEVAASFPGARFAEQGALFYSEYAGECAKRDMTLLGGISAAALLAVLFAAFRTAAPLALGCLSVATGALAGIAATIAVFGGIHMITLVMSLSLIGISADYTTHFFTARMTAGPQETPEATASRLRPVLLQALLTTCAAYAALLFAPFPGLRQLGVFSVAGLAASFFTVIALCPLAARRCRPRPLAWAGRLDRYCALWRRDWRLPAAVIGLVAVFAAGGLLQVSADDDLKALQAAPRQLQDQEAVIASVTGRDATQRWLIASGRGAEQALQGKDALLPGLAALRDGGIITGATVLPINSEERQRRDIRLIEQAMPEARRVLGLYGIEPGADARLEPLALQPWLQDYLSAGWRRLVIESKAGAAILIPVQGERGPAADHALESLARSVPGAFWVDRRADFTRLFRQARVMVGAILAAAGAAIFLFYAWRYGARRAAGLLMPCVLSIGAGLGALGWAGLPVNIFSLFALILILGLGIDYSLFFGALRERSGATLFAVATAALTTFISLGILAFSGTAAVANFGLVLTAGIAAAFLTSPVSLALERPGPGEES